MTSYNISCYIILYNIILHDVILGLRPPLRLRPAGPGRGGRAVPSGAVLLLLLIL